MHTQFLRKRVLENACGHAICAHLMRVFPFVIHSQDCVILWHCSAQQKTKQKAIPTNTAKRMSLPTEKQPIRFFFTFFSPGFFDGIQQFDH